MKYKKLNVKIREDIMAGRIVSEAGSKPQVIPMREMRPLQVARVASGPYRGHIVFKHDGVINLTKIGLSEVWLWPDLLADVMVELLPKGEKIILELYND